MSIYKIRWGRVIIIPFIVTAVVLAIFFAWYYFKMFVARREDALNKEKFEAIEAKLREKYCIGGPYDNKVIRDFCEGE